MGTLLLKILTKIFLFLIWFLFNKIDSVDNAGDDFNDGMDEDGIWKKITYVGFECDYDDNMVILLFDLFGDVD